MELLPWKNNTHSLGIQSSGSVDELLLLMFPHFLMAMHTDMSLLLGPSLLKCLATGKQKSFIVMALDKMIR